VHTSTSAQHSPYKPAEPPKPAIGAVIKA
jgi:hypothetical protein